MLGVSKNASKVGQSLSEISKISLGINKEPGAEERNTKSQEAYMKPWNDEQRQTGPQMIWFRCQWKASVVELAFQWLMVLASVARTFSQRKLL